MSLLFRSAPKEDFRLRYDAVEGAQNFGVLNGPEFFRRRDERSALKAYDRQWGTDYSKRLEGLVKAVNRGNFEVEVRKEERTPVYQINFKHGTKADSIGISEELQTEGLPITFSKVNFGEETFPMSAISRGILKKVDKYLQNKESERLKVQAATHEREKRAQEEQIRRGEKPSRFSNGIK